MTINEEENRMTRPLAYGELHIILTRFQLTLEDETAVDKSVSEHIRQENFRRNIFPKVEAKYMWEIFVPTISNDGVPFRTRYHKVWDAKVRVITNGLTIFKPAVGQWEFKGKLFKERMIPVRIMCTEKEMNNISDMTAKYYNQLAICFYKFGEATIKEY